MKWVLFALWCAQNAASDMVCSAVSPPAYWPEEYQCEGVIEPVAIEILKGAERHGFTVFWFDAKCVMVRGEPV